MLTISLKMLFNDRAKYFGIIMGVTLAALVICQQGSIFIGLMSRTYALIGDMGYADVWVMDPKVQFIDDSKPLQDTALIQVRGVSGVGWAVPLYKGNIRAKMTDGTFQNCVVLGLDDASLVGGPPEMVEGRLEDLRRSEAVIVDVNGARERLARPPLTPGGPKVPLKVGDLLELNDHRAVVVGLARTTRTFQNQPTIYTTYSRATTFAPRERKLLSFVLVKAAPGQDLSELTRRITQETGYAAYTNQEFKWLTVVYFLKNTGIPISFGTAVLLAFFVGTLITGFMFYNFTLDNLKYFGTLKAMGVSDSKLLGMIMLQAIVVAVIGFGLGVGGAALYGLGFRGTQLAFYMPWQLVFVAGCAVVIICMLSAMLSARRVISLEPAIVFKG